MKAPYNSSRTLCLLLLLLLAGCSSLPVREAVARNATISISPTFSLQAQADIIDGISRWESDTRGAVNFVPVIGGEGDVTVLPGSLHGYVRHGAAIYPAGEELGLAVGVTYLGNKHATVVIDTGWLFSPDSDGMLGGVEPDERMVDVSMHELGHTLGLNHIPLTIMCPVNYCGGRIDPTTELELGISVQVAVP